ncbi:glycosyltransferase, group 2 family protein [delta proteobacterium NaphS2]|nr:glycosyltransferase, group 2 family protein [delta proteobacterium NaphS2]
MGKPVESQISACIICHNEEQTIERCLKSLKWVHDIVVVDSMSTDRTREIAKAYTDRIIKREWPGYAAQKNFALENAKTEWVLSLDADEAVSEGLRREILEEIAKADALDGYRIPRRSFYQGRWINHSGYYPDRQLRLFRRDRGKWVGGRVHERMTVDGHVGVLKNDILHYPYGGGITGQLNTINSFSTLLANDMFDRGKRFHLALLFSRPFFKFLEVYVLKRGFLDGLPGLIIAVSDAYAMFVRYVKLRELEKKLT